MVSGHSRSPAREAAPALEIANLSKTFGGVRALRDVAFTVREGEIHGLLGENGSGKSTVIKILAGYHAPDSGELKLRQEPVRLPLKPGQFRDLGLEFVHQDLGLIGSLTVVENLFLGELAAPARRFHMSWRRQRKAATEAFERYGVALDPRSRVDELGPLERALLAIVRAAEQMRAGSARGVSDGNRPGVLVLDEPTVFLPRAEVLHLFSIMRELAQAQASVLFVSHDLDEVRDITDRVTVLRDGRVIGTVVTSETSESELVQMIIGRRLGAVASTQRRGDDSRDIGGLSVRGLSGNVVHDLSFGVTTGEVLGLTGLVGSGFEEIPYLLFGASEGSGSLSIFGDSYDLRDFSPGKATEHGIVLVPGDRQRDGTIASLPVVDNVTLSTLSTFYRAMILRRREMVREAGSVLTEFDVRPSDPRALVSSLSGGNQQKVLLAKWLQLKPRVLLLQEPTQGVDVGARLEIFSLIRKTAEGVCVVCASADYEQLAMICDRVLVLHRGGIAAELSGSAVTKELISETCLTAGLSSSRVPVPQ